jgi:hypothetical protein
MADLATLRDLQRRLREATGSDRNLDEDIFENLGGAEYQNACRHAASPCGAPVEIVREDARSWAPPYTKSLDAVVARIEHALPGRAYLIGNRRPEFPGDYGAVIWESMSRNAPVLGAGEHPANLAITACLALVSALIAIEDARERSDG